MDKDYMVKRMEKLLKEEQEKLIEEVKEKVQKAKTSPEPTINFRIKRD